MVARKDYDDLAAAGGIPKAKGKRKPEDGRTSAGSTLKSYAPMKKVNRERLAERRADQFGVQAQACRDIGICCHCGVQGVTVPHHHMSCAAGGEDCDTLPLLIVCHSRVHTIGPRRFWEESGISPEDALYAMREWVAAGCPQNALPWGKR